VLLCSAPASSLAAEVEVTHCDADPGAIFPQRVFQNVTVGAPYTPREVEVADHESPPEGGLTATANWGDGTSTSATVKPGTVSGCFLLSTSGHSYANPGPVTFSFTIHNSHTGADHTTDEETFTVWSVPTLIPGSTPGTIDAQVGVPWSGVVGEFSYDSAQMLATQYTTRIDWGDLLASPGTITQLPNGRFTVSASHTYTAPFEGRAVVDVLGSYEDLGLESWPIANVLATATPPVPIVISRPVSYKFLRAPILAAVQGAGRTRAYTLLFRLNHQLPRTISGKIEASLSAFGRDSSAIATLGSHRTHACYAVGIGALSKRTPKAGKSYSFKLSVHGTPAIGLSGKAALRRYPSVEAMRSSATKLLGC